MLNRAYVEAMLLSTTSAQLSYSLTASLIPGAWGGALAILTLTALAVVDDLNARPSLAGFGYTTRLAASDGVGVGSISLPWAFAGLAILRSSGQQGLAQRYFPLLALTASAGASAASLLFLKFRSHFYNSASAKKQCTTADLEGSRKLQQNGRNVTYILPASTGVHKPRNGNSAASTSLANGCGHKTRQQRRLVSAQCRLSASRSFSFSVMVLIALLAALLWHAHALTAALTNGPSRLRGSSAAAVAINAATSAATMHALLSYLPCCFTVGEAMVAAHALSLLSWDAIATLVVNPEPPALLTYHTRALRPEAIGIFAEALFVAVLAAGLVVSPLLPGLRLTGPAAAIGTSREGNAVTSDTGGGSNSWWHMQLTWQQTAVNGMLLCGGIAAIMPAVWVVRYVAAVRGGPLLLAYWTTLLAIVVPLIHWVARHCCLPVILVRKGYHLLAAALFVPALLTAPQLLALAMSIALALMAVLEVVRLAQLPVLGPRLQSFMVAFTDSRDSGPLLISHVSLLTGCATPVWLADLGVGGGVSDGRTSVALLDSTVVLAGVPLAAFAGIVALGVADSAASAIGLRYGRHRMFAGSKKTVEGTVGGALVTAVAWIALVWVARGSDPLRTSIPNAAGWGGIMASTAAACLFEASTTQLDNVFLPLHLFSLLCLL